MNETVFEQLRRNAPIIPVVQVTVDSLEKEEQAPHITEYSVTAHVKDRHARVITEFALYNPNSRVLEGELEFPLPDEGVVCGYAIDIQGTMVEGRVVEKEKARIAFEAEVKRGIDPGLVEQVKGNLYKTRIYPIPARGCRRIRVIYVTPLITDLKGNAALFLPMPQHKLDKRDVSISVEIPGMQAPVIGGLGDRRFESANAIWNVEAHDTDLKPEDHLFVGMPALQKNSGCLEDCDGDIYFSASIVVEEKTDQKEEKTPENWRIIWDASKSRNESDVTASLDVLKLLPETGKFDLHIFRNVLEEVQHFTKVADLIQVLKNVDYDGGTHLGALKEIAAQSFEGMTLVFSDGIDTFGSELPQFGARSVALSSATQRDVVALKYLCGGRFIDPKIAQNTVMTQILSSAPTVSAVRGAVSDVQGIGLDARGNITILGRMRTAQESITIELSDGREYPVEFAPLKDSPCKALAVAWASRRIQELSSNAEDHREELLALGRHFSIVSPVSSMIVFENLDQWLRYDIEPPESLKEIHEQWVKKHPSAADLEAREAQDKKNWKNRISQEWEQRVLWWKSPVPKVKSPSSGLFDDEDGVEDGVEEAAAGGRGLGSAVSNVARRVAAAASDMVSNFMPSPPRNARRRESDEHMVERRSARREVMMEDAPVPMAGMAAPMAMSEPMECCEECCACAEEPAEEAAAVQAGSQVEATISIKPWDPNTPYLTALKDASKIFTDEETLYSEYLKQRKKFGESPAFFLDCAGFFFGKALKKLAIRILSNLSEMKLEDTALLRVYAWRLREAGELDDAIAVLRKIIKLRPDEAVSWRDLALTLDMRARKTFSEKDASEALECFHKAVFNHWKRDDAIWTSLVALEEMNALIAWIKRQEWKDSPKIPEMEEKFLVNLDTDLRIVLMWDADNTDIDLHVMEPSGEEVFYQNQHSRTGGLLSFDVRTGYGPEEYLHKTAPKGKYRILANYFGSSQQSLTGQVTVTVTVFTNWGRSDESSQILSLRLEKVKDKATVGSIKVD